MFLLSVHQALRRTLRVTCGTECLDYIVEHASVLWIWVLTRPMTAVTFEVRTAWSVTVVSAQSKSSHLTCITAFITRFPGTWWTFRSPMWPVANIFVLPRYSLSSYTGVGHLLLLAQLPGTHRAMICEIRRLALTVSDVCLKLCCFQSTTSVQRSRGIALYVLYKFTTYSLTYLDTRAKCLAA